MTNYTIDLDLIACEIENAENMLRCFTDFWQDEGYIPPDADLEKKRINAISFAERSEQYIVLVNAAVGVLMNNQQKLQDIIDKMLQELRQSA